MAGTTASVNKLWVISTLKKGVSYEVLEYNEATKMVKMKGKYATVDMTVDNIKSLGYKLTKERPNV